MPLPEPTYRRQGAVEDEPQPELGADYEGSGSGDDYWCYWYYWRCGGGWFQNININNGRK